MAKIAIVGASGKLGGATLSGLLTHKLAPASDIIALTSSTPESQTWSNLATTGAQVRHARFEDAATFERALQGDRTARDGHYNPEKPWNHAVLIGLHSISDMWVHVEERAGPR
ncbi:hypothetical protein EKO27_g10043 [Xylaria grammica]|uniref:NAD(P)-binding domain-containing protein n=1 Tax=Xylaria grammica TaxID=363999 RepID=A0A439CSD9_9PEZI|nr:hypothetical protein EKO27_g10043 [Xylaria grammica]